MHEPGTRYLYSSYGYNLAGAAIEGASGRSYDEIMREMVWAPAGMTDTRLDSPTEIIPHRVTGYRLDGDRLRRSDFVAISSRFAAGGTRSTVVDMPRFARALHEGKLLDEASPSTSRPGRFSGLLFACTPMLRSSPKQRLQSPERIGAILEP